MPPKKYKWFKIAEPGESIGEENEIRILEVNGKKISITRWKGNVYGFAFKCPHAGGILADGEIDPSGNVICPNHRYKYNIANGYNTSGEGYFLSTYPIESREDGIYLGFLESSIWDIFRK